MVAIPPTVMILEQSLQLRTSPLLSSPAFTSRKFPQVHLQVQTAWEDSPIFMESARHTTHSRPNLLFTRLYFFSIFERLSLEAAQPQLLTLPPARTSSRMSF